MSRDLEILIIWNWTFYLDSIETNIENAVVDIQQGNTQLRQARDHQVKYELGYPRPIWSCDRFDHIMTSVDIK